jgi:hypothetical protein
MTDVADTFRYEFLATFPRAIVPDDTVVMSMRGADVTGKNPPGNYWQPPCSYYTDVQKQFRHSIVLCQDWTNPCVNVSVSKGAVFDPGTFMTAFSKLLWAKNVVLSRSSFPRAALYMSPFRKNFYVFEGDVNSINGRWNMFVVRFLEHGDHWECLASDEYKQEIVPGGVGRWRASKEQMELLQRDKCNWTRRKVSERSYVPLPRSKHDVGCGWFVEL